MHISEARVAAALDKLAYMEELVNDRLLPDKNAKESEETSSSYSSSTQSLNAVERRLPLKSLNVSGPVQPYHPRLKNFWYPVAFSTDLKDDTMVRYSLFSFLDCNFFRRAVLFCIADITLRVLNASLMRAFSLFRFRFRSSALRNRGLSSVEKMGSLDVYRTLAPTGHVLSILVR